jgi:PAS domain S-box-containing protein
MRGPAEPQRLHSAPAFLDGGGALGALMRAHDWTTTPLGPPSAWPQPLKTLVGLMLGAGQPMFIAWGPERTLLYNDAYSTIMGDRHPAALARPFFDVWPDAVDECIPLFAQVFAGEPVNIADITLYLARPGRPREVHFAFSYTPVRAEDGAVAGLFCVCSEITEQVFAHRREAQAAERQRALFQQMPGFVAVLSGPDHVFEYVNDAYVALSGARDFIGRSVRAVFPDLHDQAFYAQLDEVYRSGHAFKGNDVPLHLTGDVAPQFIDHMYQPLRNAAGEITGIFVVGHDVTDRVRAREAVHAERERGEAARRQADAAQRRLNATLELRVTELTAERNRLWNMTNLLVATSGFDNIIREVSPGWQAMLGWAPSHMIGQSYAAFIHADDVDRSLAWAAQRASGSALPALENRYRHKDGSYRWIAWTVTAGQDVFYCVGRDVTDLKQQTEARIQAEDQLRQSQKMEAVGHLTGGLAHDFNNLLAGISGALELLNIRVQQGRYNDVERYMAVAMGSTRRAAALTHRLLAFSRRQTLDPKPTDVNKLVTGMHDLIQRTVGPAIPVEMVGAYGLWPALVDPSQLENALLNLCINARDAMPAGGRITVETANKWMDATAARQQAMPEGQYLAMSVTDTGTGMPPEVVARAFDPFFTTKPIGEGTGLGLSMIYGFAKQSGGQVRIYSEVGQGTTVAIYLPRHHGAVDADDDAARPAPVPSAAQEATVLVVDDEPAIRMLVTEIVEDLGYTALEAGDSMAGLQLLDSGARIDLLVTDIGLPGGMNGRQMADAGRSTRADLKVLFITGYAENAVFGNGHLAPGMAVLTKPFPIETMAARIRTLIEDDDAPTLQRAAGGAAY